MTHRTSAHKTNARKPAEPHIGFGARRGAAFGPDRRRPLTESRPLESDVPPLVHEVLHRPGQPLDPTARDYFESRMAGPAPTAGVEPGRSLVLGNPHSASERAADRLADEAVTGPALRPRTADFSMIRTHTGELADRSARQLEAAAYTVGRHIVFAAGRYAPHTATGSWLLAHELAHATQPGSAFVIRRQPAAPSATQAPSATPTATAPRLDYVFIMGEDPPGGVEPFFRNAERFYRARLPAAVFVTNQRSLAGVLSWVNANVSAPIGNLYLISHANEDGTLSFGLNAADTDRHLSVLELRHALDPATGGSMLPRLGGQVDAGTRVHIKGCDIGRTQTMIELIEEAFGGQTTVDAPTHEQAYGTDPFLARQARREFRQEVEQAHPEPPPVDPTLRGRERLVAQRERQQALRQRRRDINAELAARHAEEEQRAELAGTFESFTGPLFQRPGAQPFARDELSPQVDRLYPHLSARQRQTLVRELVARDPRATAVAERQGTFRQRGQRIDRRRIDRFRFEEPRTPAEVNRLFGRQLRAEHFIPTAVHVTRTPVAGGFDVRIDVEGTVAEPGQPRRPDTRTFDGGPTVPDDATMINTSRPQLPNPDRYAWRVEETHSADGFTTRVAVAERVITYLHHRTLDPSAHEHFTRPLTDPDFFGISTTPRIR